MGKFCYTLFPYFCFRLLWLWFVFFDSVSVLRFNFVFLCVFPVWDAYFRLGICVSVFWQCFSVLGFRFVLCVSVLGWFFPIFVVVVVVLRFFCFYRPPYIFDSPLLLNPATGEHFKTQLKFLHRYQIVQVRNNLL